MGYLDDFVQFSHQLSNLFAATVFVKSEYLDQLVSAIAVAASLREDYVRLLASIIISFPLIILQNFIRSPTVKKIYTITIGVSLLQFCFGVGWIHSFISGLVVYLLMRFSNPRKQPIYVFVFSLCYLSLSALYTMLTDYMSYTLDSTTYQMMLVSRFQMLAWSVFDGTVDRAVVDKGAAQTDRWGRIYKRRQAEYVTSLPSLLDYFSFVYHYPGILGGPNTYYREFIDIIENRRYPYGAIPAGRWRWAALNLGKGVLFLGLFVAASIWVPESALLEEAFAQRWLGTRIAIAYLTYVGVRFRYYGLWKLGESLCICGGYGETEKGKWDGISNVDIVDFEFCTSMSMATHAWNKRTQRWLQMCIYERSHFNQLYVFLVSAFWHGFYPSYYLCFLTGSGLQAVNKIAHSKLWPYVSGSKWEKVFLRLGNVYIMMMGTFMFGAMFSYSFEKAWAVWKALDFYGLWQLVVSFLILLLVPAGKPKEKKE
ncbi:uncharacterized protein [Blastocystis hominis]|uniref:Membrane bound O-acyl transferase n=1 Tax=Blastocystis hominis TaxID=12968 RepID=D8M3G5_BLAHO|nr:uncharacterized protein [Blastocystis hominis]CBK22438.2 unnamed protein product [Blastocystis hominis]|eukprot:XP_012896486.1 uncharacterized protein [Blastocystis hominis]